MKCCLAPYQELKIKALIKKHLENSQCSQVDREWVNVPVTGHPLPGYSNVVLRPHHLGAC